MNDEFHKRLNDEYIAALAAEVVRRLNICELDLSNYTDDSIELMNFILDVISEYYSYLIKK